MGSRTDEAEQRVAEQRARITQLLDNLELRVRDDVSAVGDDLSTRVTQLGNRAGDMLDVRQHLPGADMLATQVSNHPLTAMLGSFGAGVALGMSGDSDDHRGQAQRTEAHRDGLGTGVLEALTSVAVSALAAPIRDETQLLVRRAVSAFLGSDEAAHADRGGTHQASPRH